MASKNVSSTAPGGETVPPPPWPSFRSRRNNGTAPGSKEGGRLPIGSRSGATASATSNASMPLSTSAAGLPDGVVIRRYKRLAMYRMSNFNGVIRLVAKLLFKVSRYSRGSVFYLNARRLSVLLGLDARFTQSTYRLSTPQWGSSASRWWRGVRVRS